MMAADVIVAKADGGVRFAPHPEGQYALQCVDVIDLGERVEQFQQQPARVVHKAALVFRSGELNDDGGYYEVSKEVTVSMNEKANLRKFLGSWRGKSYSDEEAEAGAPLHKLDRVYALASIEHKTSVAGRIYANIAAIGPLPKAMPKPNTGDYERAAFWTERKATYATDVAKLRGTPSDQQPAAADDDDDDLPF